ncbi:hypothetical protein [Nocardioides sp.]|uniref:hypothetical protein n=1 Tax=Nocardioides sp. TaxID=35761 RepID=UPI002ED0F7C8
MNLLAQAAAAATLVLAPLVVPLPAQAATESTGVNCVGKQVVRCVWFNVDRTNNRLRARSGIWDAAVSDPDPNYSVATSQVRLQRYVGGTWRYWSGSYFADYDGWHGSVDRAAGGLVGCGNGNSYTVRAVVHQKWTGSSPGSGTQYGPRTSFVC